MNGRTPHLFVVKKLEEAFNDSGAVVRTYVTNRSVRGRAIRQTNRPLMDHGVRGELRKWHLQTLTDPNMDIGDRVEFDYGGVDIVIKITLASVARIGTSNTPEFWVADGEEDSTEV